MGIILCGSKNRSRKFFMYHGKIKTFSPSSSSDGERYLNIINRVVCHVNQPRPIIIYRRRPVYGMCVCVYTTTTLLLLLRRRYNMQVPTSYVYTYDAGKYIYRVVVRVRSRYKRQISTVHDRVYVNEPLAITS